MNPKRVLILNSYTLTERPAVRQVRVEYFFRGLAEGGYYVGNNLYADIVDSNDLDVIEQGVDAALNDPPDVIHAVGTPNAVVARNRAPDIPLVYYGAHPEGVGRVECSAENVCGVVLTLPFTYNYKRFRFIRKLLPDVERLYVPFYERTVFCPEVMRSEHRRFRQRGDGSPWMPMDCELIGYAALSGLCYIVGLEYRELVYRDAEDLSRAMARMETEHAGLIPYNDNVYCRRAPEVLLEFSRRTGVPLIWNNNPEATQVGALAAIAGCFKEAGLVNGRQAGRILDGARPAELGSHVSSRSYASINLHRAEQLGLHYANDVLDHFDEILR